MRQRTRQFALRIIKLYGALPKTVEAQVLGKQILGFRYFSGGSLSGSVSREIKSDFISKIEGGLQELDETLWLELLEEANIVGSEQLGPLKQETNELIAMFVTMSKGLKQKKSTERSGVVIPHPSALIP